jgi:hypothetical protein
MLSVIVATDDDWLEEKMHQNDPLEDRTFE